MDTVLDRVRAADPADPAEFGGLANFDALTLDPPRRRRGRRRLLAFPGLAAIFAAVIVVPGSAPQASEIIRRANAAIAPGDGILYAKSRAERRGAGGSHQSYGTRQVWVHGEAMRWLEDSGNEEVSDGSGVTRFDPRTGKVTEHPDMRMVAGEIFRAGELLRSARAKQDVELLDDQAVGGRDAYVLRWYERRAGPVIEMTLWVDKDTYEPLRFTDHSRGDDVTGKPFDETFTETVLDFETLPDTPENRELLEMSPNPGS
jgi:outer membrane lipoprotein-sorting protein